MMTRRSEFLSSVMGAPWVPHADGPDAYDCWHLTRRTQSAIFGRDLPDAVLPASFSARDVIAAVASHPERTRWHEVEPDEMGFVPAPDGAIVLMARVSREAHVGTWFAPEARVLHADERSGVIFDDLASLRAAGWHRITFYAPNSPR